MLGQRPMGVDEYVAILRRRWVLIAIPGLLGPIIGYGISRFLPERYTSQTLVLVQQQQVPDRFVLSVVNDDFNQRLSTMQEQILSRTRLQPVIEKHSLFKGNDSPKPMEDLVGLTRRALKIATVRALGGPATDQVPGFTIAFTYHEPQTAQLVCQEITSMFIDENLRLRGEKASNTAKFLEGQLQDAKAKLDGEDAKLAAFKARHIGQMPGKEDANLGLLMSSNAQLDATTQLIARTQQDKAYLESLLAQQLNALQTLPAGTSPQTLQQQLTRLQAELMQLEGRYQPSHPDVARKNNEIAQMKKRIEEQDNVPAKQPEPAPEEASAPEPPQIQQLRNQIRMYEQTIREKTRDQQRLQDLVRTYQARVLMSPAVEQEYKELTRGYNIALGFYNDLLGKKTEAEISVKMETAQQGEQFRVMDAANLPTSPSYPDRLMFAGGGLGGGLALGLGIVLLLEMKDKAMRNELDVEFFLELPALAHVPSVGPAQGRAWHAKQSAEHTGQDARA